MAQAGIWGRYVGRFQKTGSRTALAMLVTLAVAIVGYRLAWYPFTFVVNLLMLACGLALLALVTSALALFSSRHAMTPLAKGRKAALAASLVASLAFLLVLGSFATRGKSAPMIHDISTDTESPPEFEFVLPLRKDSPNPAAYEGAEVAAMQKSAYPEVAPLIIDAEPTIVYLAALEIAKEDWEIVVAEPHRGRIEATDTTAIFGFKDDIVVRVQAEGQGSRIDVRSLSRLGKSDLGTNAKRITRFLKELKESI